MPANRTAVCIIAFHVPFSRAWVAVGVAVPAVVGFSVALGGVLLGSLLTYFVRGRPAESGGR